MVHAITSEFLVNDKTEFAQHDSAITPFVGAALRSAGSMFDQSVR